MKAFRFKQWQQPGQLEDIAVPEPGPGEALIRVGGGVFEFSYAGFPEGCSLMTVLGGSTGELAEVVALAEAGKVKPRIERLPLEDVSAVCQKLQANEMTGRAVLIP